MNAPDLLAEGESLSRSCAYLRPDGDHYAAVWGGDPLAASPGAEFDHWLSVDVRYIPNSPWPEGCLSVFANTDDCTSGALTLATQSELPLSASGVRLFAHEGLSLPPLDAVFRYGSPDLHAWLRSCGWDPTWPPNSNFRDPVPVEAYEKEYQRRLPLYSGGAHAVLGGWHFPWPDGDWFDLTSSQLLVWTFQDSEPWIEAWNRDGHQWVVQRVT
jgi:hypothetical protein